MELKRSIAEANESDFSDDEMWNTMPTITTAKRLRGGSKPGRKPNLPRDRHEAHKRIVKDYFAKDALYSDAIFRRRFRMRYFNIKSPIHYNLGVHCF